MRRLRLLLLAALLAVGAPAGAAESPECPRWRAVFDGMPTRSIRLDTGRGTVDLVVRLADTPERQAGGFQCASREQIADNLILFDFGAEILTQFHMDNVVAPLDIAFIRADGRVAAVLRMNPSPTALYGPRVPFRYALEAPAGFFADRGIRPGARLLPAR